VIILLVLKVTIQYISNFYTEKQLQLTYLYLLSLGLAMQVYAVDLYTFKIYIPWAIKNVPLYSEP